MACHGKGLVSKLYKSYGDGIHHPVGQILFLPQNSQN